MKKYNFKIQLPAVRPPSSNTPNSEASNDVASNDSAKKTFPTHFPTTPTQPINALPSIASNVSAPRSPLTLVSQNSNSSHFPSGLNHTADNSNMSFTQDHDDDTSMTSDEPSCSSPSQKQISSALSSHASNTHPSSSSKSAASIAAHHQEVLQKICEMGSPEEAEQRKEFAGRIGKIWEDYNLQCRNLPNINKVVLDLYRLYALVSVNFLPFILHNLCLIKLKILKGQRKRWFQ